MHARVTSALVVLAACLACAAAPASAATVVATATSVSGSDVYVLHAGGSTLSQLHKGAQIRRGDIISAGPGVRASFTLAAQPASTARGTHLFAVFKDLTGGRPQAAAVAPQFSILAGTLTTHHHLALARSGSRISLTLSP
jgi:hypothetical protein